VADPTRRSTHSGSLSEEYVLVASLPGGRVLHLELPSEGEVVIGREEDCDLCVPDDSVSRRHARVSGGSPPEIEDLGSTNGTRVLGHPLRAGARVPLRFGAVVELGNIVAFVQPRGAEEPVPAAAARPARGRGVHGAIVHDPAMIELYELVDVIAPSKMSILILGETGVGKDVYAETVHRRSDRASGPFLRLNCAALPENLLEAELFGYERGAFTGAMQSKPGLFESADGGTVFLDEVGEMPLVTQAKLLRVLESGEVMRLGSLKPKRVDVRFISATNRDLEAQSELGQFRSDLFFRLNGVNVVLPPLRKRRADVMPLAQHFLAKAAEVHGRPSPGLSAAASEKLATHRWPGNIRELKNVIERAALMARGPLIEPEHLTFGAQRTSEPMVEARATAIPPPNFALPESAPGAGLRDEVAEMERKRIAEAMEKCGGNQSRAAKMLGISRGTLIRRLEQYGHTRPRKGQE
jgi:DNA-binding NtrC family response regulator